jgi:putative DNA primase/helicase
VTVGLIEDYLGPRGVTDSDVIMARGYEETGDGIKIPLYSVGSAQGDGQPYGYEVRLIPPRIVKRDGKTTEQKFDRPKGQPQQLSVNPMYWEPPADDRPLWIVEGTCRADALHQRAIHSVVSLTSCWGWKNRSGVDSQLDELPLRGREIWLWFDGDVATKREVNLAAHRFSAVLESRGAVIRYGLVPDGLGLDDYLAQGHDVMALRMLLVDDLPLVEDPVLTEDQFREGTSLPRTSDAALARAWLDETSDVCHVGGEWWAHVQGRWQRTPGGQAARTRLLPYLERVGETYQEIGDESGSPRARAFGRKTREILESSAKGSSVLTQGLAVELAARYADSFDANPWLLNLANGTLDLRSREFWAHRPEDMLTGIAPVLYDPNATAPQFQAFLDSALPDTSVQTYLARMMGAMLPGMTLSQRVLVFSGRTRAGKGTMIRALFGLLGRDYSGELRREVIMKGNRGSADHQTQVMWLKGRRAVSVNETNEGEEFDAAKLKMLSGGDEITARGMHQDQTTFRPTHNMILSTNALPNVDSSDLALWGRLRVIPFRQSFLGQEDETLDHRLQEETSGILNWLLSGLSEYLDGGEGPLPADVARAKAEWRDQGDSVAAFAEQLLQGPVPKGRAVPRADLRLAYDNWCQEESREPVGVNTGKFKTGLEAKGFVEIQLTRAEHSKRPRFWTHPAVWGDRAPLTEGNQSSHAGTGRSRSGTGLALDRELGLTCVELDALDECQSWTRLAPFSLSVILDPVTKLIKEGRSRRVCTSSSASSSMQVTPSSASSSTSSSTQFHLLDPEAPI